MTTLSTNNLELINFLLNFFKNSNKLTCTPSFTDFQFLIYFQNHKIENNGYQNGIYQFRQHNMNQIIGML